MEGSDVGLIGMGVMGQNLVKNLLRNGYKVSIYNRTFSKCTEFADKHKNTIPFENCNNFVMSLKKPRIILVLIEAGQVVDILLNQLLELLNNDDIVVDLGNTYFKDTERRIEYIKGRFMFLGCGISGGEEGALNGPSLMPGGDKNAWEQVKNMLWKISAKYNNVPCCEYIGRGGAGHFVKLVHNGIEYCEMAIIAEICNYLKLKGYSNAQVSEFYQKTREITELNGYLCEIVASIFKKQSENQYFIDQILDVAENKGTGIWTLNTALELKLPATVLAQAINSRLISGKNKLRKTVAKKFKKKEISQEKIEINDLISAIILSKSIAYIQGFALIKEASQNYKWNIDMKSLCSIWKNGCIIRGDFLEVIDEIIRSEVYETSNAFLSIYEKNIEGLRRFSINSIMEGIAIPSILSAISYIDEISTERGSGYVIQAMRDYFGAHCVVLEGNDNKTHILW